MQEPGGHGIELADVAEKDNSRRNVPSVDGARTPVNSPLIPPGRSRSMSSMESAPQTIQATSARIFAAAFAPPPFAVIVSRSVSSRGSPHPISQRQHRNQPGARHEVRIVEHR